MIILFNPQSTPAGRTYLPLSLLALGAVLEGKREYCLVDGNLDTDPAGSIEKMVRESGSPTGRGWILGVTVMPGPQLRQAVEVGPRLRKALPELTIVWGGYFPTEHTEVCLRAAYVDYVVR